MGPLWTAVSQYMVDFAGVGDMITIENGRSSLVLDPNSAASLKNTFPGKFNFVFLDHAQSRYLQDIDMLLRNNLMSLNPALTILADNVVFPGAPQYMWSMKRHPCFE